MKWTIWVELTPDGNPPTTHEIGTITSAWLKHCAPRKFTGRQVNIVAGRATLQDGKTKLYAYVGKRSPAQRRGWITSWFDRESTPMNG